VDTVFVAGQPRKWRGALHGHDLDRLVAELEASREGILARHGTTLDPLGSLSGPEAAHAG
jgi:hypothetical protein